MVTGTEWDLLLQMDEQLFRQHLKVTWAHLDFLLDQLHQQHYAPNFGGRPAVSLHHRLVMFLWYMGNQNSFREISDRFNVSE